MMLESSRYSPGVTIANSRFFVFVRAPVGTQKLQQYLKPLVLPSDFLTLYSACTLTAFS